MITQRLIASNLVKAIMIECEKIEIAHHTQRPLPFETTTPLAKMVVTLAQMAAEIEAITPENANKIIDHIGREQPHEWLDHVYRLTDLLIEKDVVIVDIPSMIRIQVRRDINKN